MDARPSMGLYAGISSLLGSVPSYAEWSLDLCPAGPPGRLFCCPITCRRGSDMRLPQTADAVMIGGGMIGCAIVHCLMAAVDGSEQALGE